MSETIVDQSSPIVRGRTLVDPPGRPRDATGPSGMPANAMISQRWAPVTVDEKSVVVATSRAWSPALARQVEDAYRGRNVTYRHMDHVEFQEQVVRGAKSEVAELMAHSFANEYPEFSARGGLARWQRTAGLVAAVALVALLVLVPDVLKLVLAGAMLAATLITVVVSGASLLPERRGARTGDPVPVADDALPFYTVLVPLYDEVDVMPSLVRSLAALDYPEDRLEVLFLIEEHDTATRAAAEAVTMTPTMRIVDIPPGSPQTKPRSCNLGLMLARGELVTIFDAEDRPDPDQLRKAAAAFAASPDDDLACVQARLSFYNATRNLITRQFELEYGLRYDMVLPGLARLGLPIPLGGTSNHFRTDVLREMGGWDAWNVTEDADLGMRCRAMGYRVGMIDSTTWEEATATPHAWIRQRTRVA